MRFLLRLRPSPALVVACISLFIVLSGVALAALPSGSVGTAQLKNGAVTKAKLKNGAVTTVKISNKAVTNGKLAADAVTTDKIKDGTITAADIAAGVLPSGAGGITGLERVSAATATNSAWPKTLSPACPAGKKVIGGGYLIDGAGQNAIAVTQAYPDSDGTKFNVRAVENNATALSWRLTVFTLCANVAS
jgi:hypothetical protein